MLLNLTVVNPCAPSNFNKEVARPGIALIEAAKRKHNKYRGTFPATYSLPPLAISMCGTLGADTQALIKAMAVRRVDLQEPMLTGQARAAAEGRETAHLHRRFSFTLQQALSQRTRFHLCRQGVLCLEPHGPPPGPELGEPGGLVELAEPGGSTGREDDDGSLGPGPAVPAEDESRPQPQAPSGDDGLAEPGPRRRSRAEDEDAEAGAPRR